MIDKVYQHAEKSWNKKKTKEKSKSVIYLIFYLIYLFSHSQNLIRHEQKVLIKL